MDARTVPVVAGELGDIDIEPGDAPIGVHTVPERGLGMRDALARRRRRTDRQVRDRPQVDAAVVRVDRIGARLRGDADVERDVIVATRSAGVARFYRPFGGRGRIDIGLGPDPRTAGVDIGVARG